MRAHGRGTTKGQHVYTWATGRDRADCWIVLSWAKHDVSLPRPRHNTSNGPDQLEPIA